MHMYMYIECVGLSVYTVAYGYIINYYYWIKFAIPNRTMKNMKKYLELFPRLLGHNNIKRSFGLRIYLNHIINSIITLRLRVILHVLI